MAMDPTPMERAVAAAQALVDTGTPVTARAVRESAGVSMVIAAEAARTVKERVAQAGPVPSVPDAVRARLDAVWAHAVAEAAAVFAQDEQRWTASLDVAQRDLAAAMEELAAAGVQAQTLTAEVETMRGERDAQRTRADGAEAALEALRAESAAARDRVDAEVATLREALRVEQKRADRAEMRLELLSADGVEEGS